MFIEIFLAVLLALYVFRWFSRNTEDDPMQYPYHFRSEILQYKKLARYHEDKNWERFVDSLHKRKDSIKEKITLTTGEYEVIKESTTESAKREVYKKAYQSMIEDNISILNGKKTIAEVEENLNSYVNPMDWINKGKVYANEWIEDFGCKYDK